MPTKRRKLAPVRIALTEKAVVAWRDGDAVTLRRELGIKPWQYGPWPLVIYNLGVDPDDPPPEAAEEHRGWHHAVELQRLLSEICPPGMVGRHGRSPGMFEDDDGGG